jgi:acetyl esterase/lipase
MPDAPAALPLWPAGAMPVVERADDAPDELPLLTPYLLPAGKAKACVVVCPGGGYHRRAPHEGEPVARWLNKLGLAALVLDYRVKHRFPASLQDARRAIQTVRHRAGEWNIDPTRVGILGFSAGGHLAGTAATLFSDGDPNAADPIERQSSRPDAAVLCYAVLSAAPEVRHGGSIAMLLGAEPWSETARRQISVELQVTPRTPPCFLWHTHDDGGVPVANALRFAEALSIHKVPCELHVYPNGRHGLGLATDEPTVSRWTDECSRWLSDLGWR